MLGGQLLSGAVGLLRSVLGPSPLYVFSSGVLGLATSLARLQSQRSQRTGEQSEARRLLQAYVERFQQDCKTAIDEAVQSATDTTIEALQAGLGSQLQVLQVQIQDLTKRAAEVKEAEAARALLDEKRAAIATLEAENQVAFRDALSVAPGSAAMTPPEDVSSAGDYGTGWAGGFVMASYRAAIDFGTSYTVATSQAGPQAAPTVLALVDEGRLSSAVALDDAGRARAGPSVEDVAALAPDRVERTPKRCLDQPDVMLGGQPVQTVDLVAAVLEYVRAELLRHFNGLDPDELCLTHPARWEAGDPRMQRLEAAAQAGRLRWFAAAARALRGRAGAGRSRPAG